MCNRLWLIIVLCIGAVSQGATDSWQSLFNGKDTEGWSVVVGKGTITVQDGVLVFTKRNDTNWGGWMLSDKDYDNFHLKYEFSIDAGDNSGLALRYCGDGRHNPAFFGYEVQIFQRGDEKTNMVGGIFGLARGYNPETYHYHGWNQMEAICIGDHILIKVNGQKISETHDRRSLTGKIGWQVHGGEHKSEIRLRNIQIRELPPTRMQPQIEDLVKRYHGKTLRPFNGKDLSGWTPVGRAHWSVQDGVIVGKDPGPNHGFLCLNERYQNYYLKLKFKIEKDNNSGVFIRWEGQDDVPTTSNAVEINIYDHSDHNWTYPTGSINLTSRAANGRVDYDDWNLLEIYAYDDHLCVYLNGQKASEGHVPAKMVRPGNIALQVGRQIPSGETSTVSFKEIELKVRDQQRGAMW